MTARDFIRQLETYLPSLNVPLEIRLADSGEPCTIYPMGGDNKVIFLISKNKK